MILYFLFFLLLYFVNFFLYCKLYAMLSFCRKGILHYILLLNLGKTDTVKALIKHKAKVHVKTTRVSYMEVMICSLYLLLLTFVNFYFVFLFLFVIFYLYTVDCMPCFHFVGRVYFITSCC